MNVLHMKYAVEIAKAGSINKASEVLLIAQPNLSRSIKELEADLGITIFDRTAHGVHVTADGEKFIGYAERILNQIDHVEEIFKSDNAVKRKFSISVPRTSYISDAFTEFTKKIGSEAVELFYKETNSSRAINNILHADYNLGIIRYAENYDKYFEQMLEEKGFVGELVTKFNYVITTSRHSPLASLKKIRFRDLQPYIEVAHADPYVPSLSLAQVKKEELPDNTTRRILVFERASQFEVLSENHETFMWVSPAPDKLLKRYDLVQKECDENKKIYKDVLIYRKDYKLSELDRLFISELSKSKKEYF
ncbi:MAG: LysR family transcriptional regulator [Oscillospiraceae bacterium]|nr:LysR family transcriptional regulator [Oscillospiraceae bacterium]